jgi:hypothetical protein
MLSSIEQSRSLSARVDSKYTRDGELHPSDSESS